MITLEIRQQFIFGNNFMEDKFLTEVQVEEVYDEQMIQEMNEYYAWLDKQQEDHEQKPSQS